MSSKVKAALITAGFAMWATAIAFGLQFASKYMTVQQFGIGLAVIGISVCFYMIYSLILTKLEFDAKLKEMVDRK